ncbi:MAG TPA: iron-containing alcohol dehydrogenase [Candidatus Dormibacteraeota bacterium]|jgi:alcohol dehydrogenase class IV|nr:iron-containing alcohol dehydrogenase [Candidatus Dormibacteraeota bacterium]
MPANPDRDLAFWRDGLPSVGETHVLVIDPVTRAMAPARRLVERAADVHEVPGRPTVPEADAIARKIQATRAGVVIAAGSGVAIDTARLAVYRHWERSGRRLEIVSVPCGPEPYRAVTPFTMFESPTRPRWREGRSESWLRSREVWVAPELLNLVDGAVIAQHAGDSLVHGMESLLSRRSNEVSAHNARRTVTILAEQSEREKPDRALLVEASIRAAIAFDTTVLGLAHAFSRPMGICAGTSHDGFNLICGFPTLEYWGDEVIAGTDLGRGLPVGPRAEDFIQVLDRYRVRAGLPRRVEETGLTWDDMEFALTTAPNSTGIPGLPRPFDEEKFRAFARLAWNGDGDARAT